MRGCGEQWTRYSAGPSSWTSCRSAIPRTNLLFDAARRAAAAADPRFLRVLDCDMHDGVTYCVREWAGGRPLERMLGTGPLTGQQAGWLAREVSEALENLHRTGHAHGSISPSTVVVTDAGAIKVVGLATEAALRSSGPGSPEQDVHALGELLLRLAHRPLARSGAGLGSAARARRARPAAQSPSGASRRTALAGRHLRPAAQRPAAAPRPADHQRRRPVRGAVRRRRQLARAAEPDGRDRPGRPAERQHRRRHPGRPADAAAGARPDPPPPAYQSDNGHQQHSAYSTAPETRPIRRQPPPPPSNGNGRRRADEPKPKGSWGGRILILLAVLALLSVVAMAQFLLKGAMNNDQGSGDGTKTSNRAADQHDAVRDRRGGQDRRRQGLRPAAGRQRRASTPTTSPNTYDGKAEHDLDHAVVQPAEPRRPEAGRRHHLRPRCADRGVQGDGRAAGRRHQRPAADPEGRHQQRRRARSAAGSRSPPKRTSPRVR